MLERVAFIVYSLAIDCMVSSEHMMFAMQQHTLRIWAPLVIWTGKVVGVLVVGTGTWGKNCQNEFVVVTPTTVGWLRWAKVRAWNVACLMAVVHRTQSETWPVTVQATRLPQASCYDTVCGGVWCVYACVFYAVAWLDRMSEIGALVAAVTWRHSSTVECLNLAAAICLDHDSAEENDNRGGKPSAINVPWHAYLTILFPIVQFAIAVTTSISPNKNRVWHTVTIVAAALASCAPVAAHGTAVAILAVANKRMESINDQIIRLSLTDDRQRQIVIGQLARRHWQTTELVAGGVCRAYGVDLMTAFLLAAVRVTYVAIAVFHRLTEDADAEENARTSMSLAVLTQLVAWFGQFAYLAYTCDELMAQVNQTLFYQ